MDETEQRMKWVHPLEQFGVTVSEFDANDQRDFTIMQADPISWSAIAGVFLVELARGAGKTFGEGLGAALANAFFGQSDPSVISRKYFAEQLEALYQKIVEAINRAVRENELRANLASTAAAQMNFIEFIRAYRVRFKELSQLDEATADPYAQAISLLPYSLPAFMNIGALRMAYGMERYARAGRVEAVNARDRIEDVMTRGRAAVNDVLTLMKNRVGREDGVQTIACLCHEPGRAGQRVNSTSDTSDEPEPQMVATCYLEINVHYLLVDGTRAGTYPDANCNVQFNGSGNRDAAVAAIQREFETLWDGHYNQQMQALERQGSRLLLKLPK